MKITHPGGNRAGIRAWVEGVPVEDQAWRQVENVARLPFIHRHVAVMPDVHWGKGATVGSVIPTLGAIVPAAVGVDIGCGMVAAALDLKARDLPDSLRAVRSAIEADVPHGRTRHGGRGDTGAWRGAPPSDVAAAWRELQPGHERLTARHRQLAGANATNHLGTLGTGNHFIELCLDETDRVWVMLHSGSRGIGNRIGTFFIERARAHMARRGIDLPDRDLAYLPERTRDFDDYVAAVGWAQRFARASREVMLGRTVNAVGTALGRRVHWTGTIVDCHHNYVQQERHFGETVWLTRKGAVSARAGELGVIPGSMGTRSYIVRGKGNPESFHSCSHGAGRRMSRTAARSRFTLADHQRATAGVECRKDADVLDETPGAYKDIDAVMTAQRDLVEIVHTLRQIVCVKG
jgi:tRNA-splicing ligase RtcB